MNCCQTLPDDYREIYSVDLQKDKKTALLITVLSLVLGIAALVLSHLLFPFSIFAILDMSQGIGPYLIRTAVLLAGMIAYIVLHELTHAAVMKYYGATKLRFGFSLMYAYAGSERDYFGKKPYIHIALAPVIVWGAIFLVLSLTVRGPYLGVVNLLQMVNLSGAAGDLYVSWQFARFPDDLLVKDTGVDMKAYSRQSL